MGPVRLTAVSPAPLSAAAPHCLSCTANLSSRRPARPGTQGCSRIPACDAIEHTKAGEVPYLTTDLERYSHNPVTVRPALPRPHLLHKTVSCTQSFQEEFKTWTS